MISYSISLASEVSLLVVMAKERCISALYCHGETSLKRPTKWVDTPNSSIRVLKFAESRLSIDFLLWWSLIDCSAVQVSIDFKENWGEMVMEKNTENSPSKKSASIKPILGCDNSKRFRTDKLDRSQEKATPQYLYICITCRVIRAIMVKTGRLFRPKNSTRM